MAAVKQDRKFEVNWSLYDLDHKYEWRPQYPISDVGITVGGNIAEQQRFGFQDSIVNWTSGRSKTISFATVLFAEEDSEEGGTLVQELLRELEDLAQKDDKLGRPPICIFTLGSSISEVCLVEAVDPLIVSTLRNTSQPREVRCNITLRKYVPFSQQQIDPTRPAKESFLLVASAAEQSYEAIARRYYGDPLLGDRLRKRHATHPFAPAVGMVVKVPARALILQEVVQPACHILSLIDEDAVESYGTILDDRNARTLSVVR
jgi:hypothetical protein